jgi:antitoxin component of MazEF toxin-antitoxin module
MRIRARILQTGKTAAGIEIPAKVVSALGASKKPPVRATINGYTYRSSIASMGGKFMLGVSNDVRKAAGVEAGEEVDLNLELDTEPREVVVPPDLRAALGRDAQARKFFDSLSYSNKRRIVIPIDDAKTEETRRRRIAKSVEMLRAGRI